MNKKDNILKKLHIKDYTNYLEKVLEKKDFSVDTQNLLLSIFYKIENSYHDYQKTKVDVYDKNDFFENLIYIIQNDCKEIEIKKSSISKNINKATVEQEKGKIVSTGNELLLLNSILKLGQKNITMPEEEKILEKSISYFLNLGNRMNNVEIIRDFNGWSWDISIKDISDIKLNLVYQTFIYLLGHDFLMQWILNQSPLADYLMLSYEKLKLNFGEEKARKALSFLCKFAIEMLAKQDKSQEELWKKVKQENIIELEKLSNKQEYIENITKEKKKINDEIERIDRILNNRQLLQNEYEQRNENLPNKEKIFSAKQLNNILEIERQEHIDSIRKYNNLIDPKAYVALKDETTQKVEFLKTLNFDSNEDNEKAIIDLCKLYLSCLNIKIAKSKTKQELIKEIYELRYYGFLTFNKKGTMLKQVKELKENLQETTKLLLEKAEKLLALDIVTEDKEINYKIVSNIFDSKMIDLNNMIIMTKVENGKLLVEYYDTNILENTVQIESNKTIKLKKKTKLFL